MKMSSLLKELPNTLIIIASLVKRFPSLREARPITKIHPRYQYTVLATTFCVRKWTKINLNALKVKNTAIDFRNFRKYGAFATFLVSGGVLHV